MSGHNLSDHIERYLRELLEQSDEAWIQIRRNSLAARFGCSPSAITYVLETRFRVERGYVVESRRGGGGYIRVTRTARGSPSSLVKRVAQEVARRGVGHEEASGYVDLLLEEDVISLREADLMKTMLWMAGEGLDPASRTAIRSKVLERMLTVILKNIGAESAPERRSLGGGERA